jgi:hypothetical protein
MLLLANPHAVDVPDRKGRLPRTLAEATSSPHREIYLEALDKDPSHYAMAAIAAARTKIIAEQNALHGAKLDQVRQIHEVEIAEIQAKEEKKREDFVIKIAELEAELTKTNETSQVLVDHVNSLEAQLASRSDTERFLATKIANLDEKLKQTESLKQQIETEFASSKTSLTTERDTLTSKVEQLQTELDSTKAKLNQTLELLGKKEITWTATEKELRGKLSTTEVEWANSQANVAILEAQLKKRMENEHSLASQVSALASRLAEQASESSEGTKKYEDLVNRLQEERAALKNTVQDLTQRLQQAAETMEFMHKQQMTIVDEAINHEQMISKALEAHAKIVQDAYKREKDLEKAREERDLIRKILDQQEDAAKSNINIMEVISSQGKTIAGTHDVRENMLTAVQEMSSKMNSTLHFVLQGIDLGKNPELLEQPASIVAKEEEKKEIDATEEEEKVVAEPAEEEQHEEEATPTTEVVEEEDIEATTTASTVVDFVDIKTDAELGPEVSVVSPNLKKVEHAIREIGSAFAVGPADEETRTDDVECMRPMVEGDRIEESREM